jgi:hypothetical protein
MTLRRRAGALMPASSANIANKSRSVTTMNAKKYPPRAPGRRRPIPQRGTLGVRDCAHSRVACAWRRVLGGLHGEPRYHRDAGCDRRSLATSAYFGPRSTQLAPNHPAQSPIERLEASRLPSALIGQRQRSIQPNPSSPFLDLGREWQRGGVLVRLIVPPIPSVPCDPSGLAASWPEP